MIEKKEPDTALGDLIAKLQSEEARQVAITVSRETALDYLGHVESTGWLTGSFTCALIDVFGRADQANLDKLASVYPEIAAAHWLYTRKPGGREELTKIACGEESNR